MGEICPALGYTHSNDALFIWTQDQLEDAHRPGEEKNEEDRDCKEEEKGINMTDDFDSHLQDVEKKGEFIILIKHLLH